MAVIPVFTSCLVVAGLAFCLLRDRPKELGLLPFGADPAQPDASPRRRRGGRVSSNPSASLFDGLAQRHVLGVVRHLLRLRPEHRRPDPDPLHLAVRRLRPRARCRPLRCWPPSAPATSSARSRPAGCPIATTCASCCSGTTGCAACRCCGCRIPRSRVVGLSLFAVFYGLDWVATVPPTVRLTSADVRQAAHADDLRLDLRRPPARRRGGRLWCGADAQR